MAEKTAPAIDEKLAQLVSSLIPEKLSKTKLDELMDKYPRPDNCPLLVAPKCNKVVWHQLQPPPKTTDTAEMSKITCRCGVCSYSSNHEGFRRVEALIDPLSGPCSFRQLGI